MAGAPRQRRPDGSIAQTHRSASSRVRPHRSLQAGPGSLPRSPSWRPPRCAPPRPREPIVPPACDG
jgi:hypothetical protein